MDSSSLDKAINILDTNKDDWVNLPISEKIPLFKSLSSKTAAVAKDWTDAALKAKSIKEDSPLSGRMDIWTMGSNLWRRKHGRHLNSFR